jgi:hypothetical protein
MEKTAQTGASNLYLSPRVFRATKLRNLRQVWHIQNMQNKKLAWNCSFETWVYETSRESVLWTWATTSFILRIRKSGMIKEKILSLVPVSLLILSISSACTLLHNPRPFYCNNCTLDITASVQNLMLFTWRVPDCVLLNITAVRPWRTLCFWGQH